MYPCHRHRHRAKKGLYRHGAPNLKRLDVFGGMPTGTANGSWNMVGLGAMYQCKIGFPEVRPYSGSRRCLASRSLPPARSLYCPRGQNCSVHSVPGGSIHPSDSPGTASTNFQTRWARGRPMRIALACRMVDDAPTALLRLSRIDVKFTGSVTATALSLRRGWSTIWPAPRARHRRHCRAMSGSRSVTSSVARTGPHRGIWKAKSSRSAPRPSGTGVGTIAALVVAAGRRGLLFVVG